MIKCDRKKWVEALESPSIKRPKRQLVLLTRYPVATESTSSTNNGDDGSIDDHIAGMELEMQRPRDSLLSELMKLTYQTRRDYIIDDNPRVSEIFGKYPALKRTAMVSKQ